MITHWEGGFARLIQTQTISARETITGKSAFRDSDNWGNFLFFNWMQSPIILNVEKTLKK